MAKGFATCLVAAFLGAFCLGKMPPTAWELQKVHKNHFSPEIPCLKSIQKHSWYIRPHKRLKKFAETSCQIANHAERNKKIKSGFEAIKRSSKKINKTVLAAAQEKNKDKNRNSHLFAFDQTRCCQEITDFYVNANDVYTPAQTYLVTQGPLEHTVADFWKAILHKNSTLIVTLVMSIEDGKDKCASYWTTPQVEIDSWTVTLQSCTQIARSNIIPNHCIVMRTFLAKNDTETRIIKQIHYENWPDGKVPELELFVKLLDVVDEIQEDQHAPITVHCSAGIGRSGTFVAAHSIRKEIRSNYQYKKNQPQLINIPKAIFLLRCQRMGLVGSRGQYATVYQTIAKEYSPRRLPFFIL